jgi:plastocyanin
MSHPCRRPGTLAARIALLFAVLCPMALVSANPSAAAATAGAARRSRITIHDYSFDPPVLRIASGTTVVWTNKDDDVHTIKSKDGPESFQSPALDSGARYGFTFRRAGTYHYVCSVHPYMHGEIVVR